MEALTLAQFERQAAAFDETVAATAGIDHFCSSSDWILPAHVALMPPRTPWLYRGSEGYVAMMRGVHPQGWHYVEPLESVWGLACPLAGPACRPLITAFVELCRRREVDWNMAVVSGLPVASELLAELILRLSARYRLLQGPITTRHVVELSGGMDGFLSRRSRNFRKALKRALRTAEEAGIGFERCDAASPADAAALYERIVQVEARSWKGREGVGIDAGGMHSFYRDMVGRLAARGRLRVMFARHRERDVAYILGAVFQGGYRGLQFSFEADYERFSLGNLCQYRQMIELCAEGCESYDLGTDMQYKRRWADTTRDSMAIIAVNS